MAVWLARCVRCQAVPAVDLRGLDFLFMIAVVFGLYAMHRLLAVREEGEVEEGVVMAHIAAEARKAVRHVSNIAGLRHLYSFPFADVEAKAESGNPGQREGIDAERVSEPAVPRQDEPDGTKP